MNKPPNKIHEGDVVEIEFNTGSMFMIDNLVGKIPELYLRPHRHRFYEMVWIEGGRGAHIIDFSIYPLKPNRIYLIAPGQIHQWKDSNIKAYVIQFTDALLDKTYRDLVLQGTKLFTAGGGQPFIELSDGIAQRLAVFARLMEEEYQGKAIDWNMIRPLLSAFLYELTRLKRNGNDMLGHPQYARLRKLRELIEDNYLVEKSVEFYAAQINLSSKRLNEVTRGIIGKTVSQMVHERLILEAKRDLSLTQDSVKTICYRLGFDDPSYFGRFFLRETGQSPNAFRDEFQRLTK